MYRRRRDDPMKLTLSIYKSRAARPWQHTAILGESGSAHAYRLCGIKLLPDDPLLVEVEFDVGQLVEAVPGLRYEPEED